jgi:hypothetical protein
MRPNSQCLPRICRHYLLRVIERTSRKIRMMVTKRNRHNRNVAEPKRQHALLGALTSAAAVKNCAKLHIAFPPCRI